MPVLIRGIFSGGGKIKDATAVPSDVAQGKVFYNNDGKQTGTANIIKSISFKTTTTTKYYQPLGSDAFDLRYDSNGKLYKGTMLLASDKIYRYLETFTLPSNIRVLYLEIDGKKYDGIGNNYNFCITIDHSPDKRLYKLGNSITVTEIKTFTVFYI